MKRLLLFIALFQVCSFALLAQGVTVTGTVTDESGETVPGATVLLKGTSTGTVTDIEGNYSLSVNDVNNDVLVISFIGYQTMEVPVAGQTALDVIMRTDVTELEEIVVVGYGVQKKKVVTGAIAKIDADDIKGFNVPRVEQALQGQVSGVIVSSGSGQPGSNQTILIRGVSTNGDNSPLYLVDGLVTDNIANLNPSDIKSVEVLKDAASTAIYGARGANGVIIVTTKKGAVGKPTFSYDGFVSSASPWRLPTMMNSEEYVSAIEDKILNAGLTLPDNFPTTAEITNSTDWMDELVEPAVTHNHQFSASKSTEGGSVYFSVGYFDQEGVIGGDKSNYRRYNARLNSDYKFNDAITIGQTLSVLHDERQSIPENNAFGSPLADAFNYDPLTPITSDTAKFGFEQSPWVEKEYINPFNRIAIQNYEAQTNRAQGNVYLTVSPIEGLTLKSDFGLDYSFSNQSSFTPSYYFRNTFQNPINDVFRENSQAGFWRWENYASYTKKINQHNASIVVGTSRRKESSRWEGSTTGSIPLEVEDDPNWWYLSAGQDSLDLTYGAAAPVRSLISYFARLQYDFKETYLFTATFRRDGSSKFGPNNRYGNFPSFSAGWIVSNEGFWDVPVVDFFKLRASWGRNGNDRIGDLQFSARVTPGGRVYAFGEPNTTVFFGVSPVQISNPNIQWEESEQLDIGFEAHLWKSKVTVEFDYYNKETIGLLATSFVPDIAGNDPPIANIGSVLNSGYEMSISYRESFGNVNFGATFNASTFNNEVTDVNGAQGVQNGYSWPVRNQTITNMEVGQPIGQFLGYTTLGIFRTQNDVFAHIGPNGLPLQPNAAPGDLIFADLNNDGVIDAGDIGNIGKPWPDFILGLNLNADYKGFDVRMLLTANIGNDIYKTYERQDVLYNNFQDTWLDRVTEDNPNGSYPRLIASDPNGNQRPSDFYVEDASFMRIKNLQVGYTIPNTLAESLKIQRLRVYMAFDNILTLTGYTGFDPEIGTSGWILDTGIDKGFYPQNRSIGAGINLTF